MSNRSQATALTPLVTGSSSTLSLDENTGLHRRVSDSVNSVWESVAPLFHSNVGLLLVILSQLSATCMNTIVKILHGIDPPVPTFEIIFIRMSITYLLSVGIMVYSSVPHPILGPPGVRWLLAVRGVTGFFGLFGIYYSLQYLSLSDAVTITFLIPTTTAIAGYLILGEVLSRKEMWAGFLSFVGVVLIARPAFLFREHVPSIPADGTNLPASEKGTNTERLIAVGVALIGVLGATGAYISIRAISKHAHPLHSVSFFSLWCCIVSVLGMLFLRIPAVIPDRPLFAVLLLAIGAFGFITQLTLTMGLQRETAGRGSLGMYVQVIFAAMFERLLFHSTPSYLSVTGTVIILSCAIYVAITKQRNSEIKSGNLDLNGNGIPRDRNSQEDVGDDTVDETHGLIAGTKRTTTPDIERSPRMGYANGS